MNHKGCGSKLVLDCSAMYSINSPSIKITNRGLLPGVIQIDEIKGGKIVLYCPTCHTSFSNKSDYEKGIEITCNICSESRSIGEIKISDTLNDIFVCTTCINKIMEGKQTPKDKILSLYGNLIKKTTFKSLLDIILNK